MKKIFKMNDKILIVVIIVLLVLIILMVKKDRKCNSNRRPVFEVFGHHNYRREHSHSDHHANDHHREEYHREEHHSAENHSNNHRNSDRREPQHVVHKKVIISQANIPQANTFKANASKINAEETDTAKTDTAKVSAPKANMIPTFERGNYNEGSAFEYGRYNVQATKTKVALPANFSSIKHWTGFISGVFDQERCGMCWSTACGNMMTDRIRIKSNGKELADGNYLSPYYLAACMKCGKDNVCPKVCEGNYLDDVLQYLVDHGTGSQSDIERVSKTIDQQKIPGNEGIPYEESFLCLDPVANNIRLYKGTRKYRVNIFPPSKLTKDAAHRKNLDENMTAIMQEIITNGPVCCIIKVYVPNDSRNFYNHKSGVYGYGWKSEPTEMDGYHAINIIGWGEELKKDPITGKDKTVKYWIIRNSWGDEWGTSGFAKVLRGENFGMIEADLWAIDPAL